MFLDVNGNGTLDSGEALSGIDVTFTVGATTFTRTTDATGTATLTGILAGTTVTIDVDTSDTDFPAGTVRTVGSDPTDVVVVANTTVTDTTGYEPQGTVTEVVFLDANGNGTLDSGEALSGIDVTFTVGATTFTRTTDATGTATLTGILAGTTVTIDVDTSDTDFPAGAVRTVGSDPTDVVVVANTTVTDTTGYEPRGDVSEVVFLDVNGDGLLDAGEALADIDVTVTIGGTPTTYTTNATGTVTISGLLAGTTVTFDVDTTDVDFPTGAVLTVGSDPTDVVVVANTTVTDTTGYEPQGTVAEVVFLDANGNGTLDSGEALSGIDVTFTVGATTFTRTTDATGTATLTGILAGTTVTIDVDTSDTDFPAGAVRTVGSDPTDVVVVANTTVTDTTGYEPHGDSHRGRVPGRQRQRHPRRR